MPTIAVGIMVIPWLYFVMRAGKRAYSDYAASVAVLASAQPYLASVRINEAFNATLHPFIRNTVGSTDFAPNNKFYTIIIRQPEVKRMTSRCFCFGHCCFYSGGVKHFALAPNNLTDTSVAIDFMKNVPTTLGTKFCLYRWLSVIRHFHCPRRHGDKWYVAGITHKRKR